MENRISVIMGIYNCESTLAEALDSLLVQSYTKFKIILCDDGSIDSTYAIAKNYADNNSNIILLKNEKNIKLAGTLNHCLKYVDTEYIARMDGDDISLPLRFEKEIAFLDKHPEYAVVSCAMVHFDENGDWGLGKVVNKPNKNTFRYRSPHAHAPCMIRTSVLREVGGYTDNEKTIRVEDYYLWYKIYKAGYKGYNLSEALYKMRDDQNALARRTFENRVKAAKINYEVLKGLGIENYWYYSFLILLKAFIPARLFKYKRQQNLKSH